MDIRLAVMILLGVNGTGRADASEMLQAEMLQEEIQAEKIQAEKIQAEKIQVEVYIQKDNWHQPLKSAEGLASEIFARSEVRVTWHAGELPASRDAGHRFIGIRMVDHAPASLSPDALASARPYGSSGSLICVYEDRVQRLLDRLPGLSPVLMAYIFAHELAHVMQGSDYHADSGILKVQWSNADHAAMRQHRLSFTDDDSGRIRDGLAVRLAGR